VQLTTKGSGAEIPRSFRAVIARGMKISFPLILFLLAFLPRAIYPVARSTLWHPRAHQFIQAVSKRDWGATLLAPHPGVTTMWLAGIANRLGSAFIPDFDQQLLHQQMAVELLPLALVISLAIVLAYFLLSRVFNRQIASVASLLLALDSFHIHISKTLHVDALMSVFAMISAY
jgi:dolichyl-phosphate-mannose--protein O-mannosyl transferase